MTSPVRVRPLQYVAGDDPARRVTWLELFFDLVFVAAVAQVAEPLRDDYTVAGLIRFGFLFVLIWWAWMGNSVFATRFHQDDAVTRVLTLIQMFGVAAMAANASESLDSESSAGFAAAYAVMRLLLAAQYARVRRLPHVRALATRYLAGHGTAAVLWLASAVAPPPARYVLWALALVIDLGTPWLAVRHAAALPPDAAHLPERVGLFTLILLGESVVAVMHGMKGQPDWTPAAATSAFLGMTIAFAIWWWYFDGARAADHQHVRSHRDAVRFHVWSFAHLPLYLGIAVGGVGVEQIVHHGAVEPLHQPDAVILAAALGISMLALTVIGAARPGARHPRARLVAHGAIATAAIAAGAVDTHLPAVWLVVGLAVCCLGQLALSRARVFGPDGTSPTTRPSETPMTMVSV